MVTVVPAASTTGGLVMTGTGGTVSTTMVYLRQRGASVPVLKPIQTMLTPSLRPRVRSLQSSPAADFHWAVEKSGGLLAGLMNLAKLMPGPATRSMTTVPEFTGLGICARARLSERLIVPV